MTIRNGTAPIVHQFSRREVKQAEHLFSQMIIKHFGEHWKIPWNGNYKGVSMDLRSMLVVDNALWHLVQSAKHAGAKRAAGKIEAREAGHVLRFIIFYDPADLTDKFE